MMAAHLVLVPKFRKVLKDRMTLIIKMTHTLYSTVCDDELQEQG